MNTLHHRRLALCVLHLLTFRSVLKLVAPFFFFLFFFRPVEAKKGFIYQPAVMASFVN